MARQYRSPIPYELQKKKAQEIYEWRIAHRKDGNPEDDWDRASKELNCWNVTAWRIKQLLRSDCRRLWQSFKALINGICQVITFPFWLFTTLPQLFANADTKPFALDVVKTIISAASLMAAIIAAIGLFVNYQDALKDRELTQERLVTDRFTKAIEQLGNDKENVIIGGIYSLERIAKDSPKDQWTIMEVLTAFVRSNSPIQSEISPINNQVQVALTVIERRDPEQDSSKSEPISLNLSNSNLNSAKLKEANLSSADLSYATLNNADLSKAKLVDADLRESKLNQAILQDADLSGADVTNAKLFKAKLRHAVLKNTSLTNVNLKEANLNSADLSDADLSDADLSGADLSLAKLNKANLREAELKKVRLNIADLSDADLSGANLEGANIRDANFWNANISNQQIKSTCFWKEAIFTESSWDKNKSKWIAKDNKANQQRIQNIMQDKDSDSKITLKCN